MIKYYKGDIFPINLWVAVNPKESELKEKFKELQENQLYELENIDITSAALTVSNVYDYKNSKLGVLIIFSNKNLSFVAHEAKHAADYYCDLFGIKYGSFEEGESHAYITQWVFTQCCKYLNIPIVYDDRK